MRTSARRIITLLKALVWFGDLVTLAYGIYGLNRLHQIAALWVAHHYPDHANTLTTLLGLLMVGAAACLLVALDRWRRRMLSKLSMPPKTDANG